MPYSTPNSEWTHFFRIYRRAGQLCHFLIRNMSGSGTRSFAELKELYAANGMVAFVCKERTDGKLVLPGAVKIMKIKA